MHPEQIPGIIAITLGIIGACIAFLFVIKSDSKGLPKFTPPPMPEPLKPTEEELLMQAHNLIQQAIIQTKDWRPKTCLHHLNEELNNIITEFYTPNTNTYKRESTIDLRKGPKPRLTIKDKPIDPELIYH
jgi:hypothetical protein